jgi:hypothetical protein
MVAKILHFPGDAAFTAENIDVEPMADEKQSGGDGGGPGDLNERVVRLETHFEYIQRDLGDIKSDQKETLGKLSGLETILAKQPTAVGLWGMIATMLGIALAIAGLTFVVADYTAKVTPGPSATSPAATGKTTGGGG